MAHIGRAHLRWWPRRTAPRPGHPFYDGRHVAAPLSAAPRVSAAGANHFVVGARGRALANACWLARLSLSLRAVIRARAVRSFWMSAPFATRPTLAFWPMRCERSTLWNSETLSPESCARACWSVMRGMAQAAAGSRAVELGSQRIERRLWVIRRWVCHRARAHVFTYSTRYTRSWKNERRSSCDSGIASTAGPVAAALAHA